MGKSPVLRHVMTLASGTMIAQIIGILLAIPLLRLYNPEAYGLFAIFQAIVAFSTTIASLRYDLAIVLPRSDVAAKVLRKLASRMILLISILSSAVCIVASRWIASFYDSQILAWWLMAAGVAVFVIAEVTNIQYWMNRKSDYRGISINRVIQTAGVSAFQLFFAIWLRDVSGLILGLLVGQFLALLLLWRHTPELREPLPEDSPSMKQMAIRYKKMPLLNGPNAVIDSIRNNGINLLIANVAVTGLGQFSNAWRIMQVPVGLLQGAIGQVFYQKMATVKPGGMLPLVTYTLKRMFLVGLPVFTVVFFLAPPLFTTVFGQEWAEAGQFARALTPWLFMMMMTSPVSNIFVVTETQQRLLVFAVFYTALPLGFLWLTPFDLNLTVWILSGIMAIMLAIMLVMSFFVARNYDRGITDGDTGEPATAQ